MFSRVQQMDFHVKKDEGFDSELTAKAPIPKSHSCSTSPHGTAEGGGTPAKDSRGPRSNSRTSAA